jgi:hypothetical protein
MTPVFYHNVIDPKPTLWDPIWDTQPNFRNLEYPFIAGSIVFVHIFICNPLPYLAYFEQYLGLIYLQIQNILLHTWQTLADIITGHILL